MLTVFQYQFEVPSSFRLDLPRGHKVLAAGVQDGTPCLWIQLDTAEPRSPVEFRVYGPGHEMDRGVPLEHRGTFQDRRFVWHVFEVMQGGEK